MHSTSQVEPNGGYVPPNNENAEQSVLGALMMDNTAWAKVQTILGENDFYQRRHQYVYRAIRRLLSDGNAADVITVADFLTAKGHIDEVGGLSYIGMLAKDTPSVANIGSYAKIVKDKSVLRQLISLGNQIASSAFEPDGKEADDLLSEAENKVFKLRQRQLSSSGGFVVLKDALKEVVSEMEANFETPPGNGVIGISSGFPELDEKLSGLSTGLYIIAGRPSMGKTALAMNFVENAAVSGNPVAVFSLETTVKKLAQRMLAGSSNLPLRLMRESWAIKDYEWPNLSAGLAKIGNIPVYIDDEARVSVSHIRSMCMRLNAEIRSEYPQGIKMIMIDYLQLMECEDRFANANDRITQISRGLKLLAKEFDVPVLVLSQLSRDVEKRADKRPVMSDLRDSGAIEQDADVIIFPYRDEYYNVDSNDKGVAEINIAKNKDGASGVTVRLEFVGYLTKFKSFGDGR